MNNQNKVSVRTGENMLIREDGSIKFGNVADVIDYSGLVVSAGMSPKGKTKEQVAVAIIAGASLGLNPFAAMQNIAVINGSPSVWGDALVGLVMASGLLEDIKTEYVPNQKDCQGVKVTIKRKGIASLFVGTFSVTQAKQSGLWEKPGPWKQYPQRMMMNRARAFALRDAFPDVLKGMSIAEEAQDIERGTQTVDDASVTPPPYAGTAKRGGAKRITADSLIKSAAARPKVSAAKEAEVVEAEEEVDPVVADEPENPDYEAEVADGGEGEEVE